MEDVPLLPLAGSFFENKDFPTGEVAKKARKYTCLHNSSAYITQHKGGAAGLHVPHTKYNAENLPVFPPFVPHQGRYLVRVYVVLRCVTITAGEARREGILKSRAIVHPVFVRRSCASLVVRITLGRLVY